MANRNSAGFGFRPSGTLGNTPATQGLSQYWIDSAATVDLFNGMAMKSTGGYMITGESATTVTTIGVLYGIYYTAASTINPHGHIGMTQQLLQQTVKTHKRLLMIILFRSIL